jgi:hypothetical protein
MKPSMISASLKLFFSARWRAAIAGSSAATGGGRAIETVNAANAAAMKRVCRRGLFIATTLTQEEGARKARAHGRQQVPPLWR